MWVEIGRLVNKCELSVENALKIVVAGAAKAKDAAKAIEVSNKKMLAV